MGISNLALNLIIILMPGIISTLIIQALTVKRNWDSFKFSIYTLLFSGLSYLILQLLYLLIGLAGKVNNGIYNPYYLNIWNKFSQDDKQIPFNEVIWASLIGIIVGFIGALFIQKKIINKIANKLGISYKFGEESLFYEFLEQKDVKCVYFRDITNGFTYHGYIQYYSESEHVREIVLSDVDVYSYDDSTFLYNSPKVFISKPIGEKLLIELPNKNIIENGKENSEVSGESQAIEPPT